MIVLTVETLQGMPLYRVAQKSKLLYRDRYVNG